MNSNQIDQNKDLKVVMSQLKLILERIEQNLSIINNRICVLEDKMNDLTNSDLQTPTPMPNSYMKQLYNTLAYPFI